jgi:hypothetical protein
MLRRLLARNAPNAVLDGALQSRACSAVGAPRGSVRCRPLVCLSRATGAATEGCPATAPASRVSAGGPSGETNGYGARRRHGGHACFHVAASSASRHSWSAAIPRRRPASIQGTRPLRCLARSIQRSNQQPPALRLRLPCAADSSCLAAFEAEQVNSEQRTANVAAFPDQRYPLHLVVRPAAVPGRRLHGTVLC